MWVRNFPIDPLTEVFRNNCFSHALERSFGMADEVKSFPPEVIDRLKNYVYRLIDPRNGETFYVGKGTGNRVFAHIHEKFGEDDPGTKLKRIHDINLAGFEVAHVIHRHGMDENTALEVEAAVIDAYPGLTNIATPMDSGRSAMHAAEVVQLYGAEEADFRHKVMLISVNRSGLDQTLYEATRYAWKVDPEKANKAELILPTMHGLIKGAFTKVKWLEATAKNFPGRETRPGRFGFVGKEASNEDKKNYVGKRVPDRYRKPGSSNPIRYTWK
jgi:hypothetical protein